MKVSVCEEEVRTEGEMVITVLKKKNKSEKGYRD